MSEFKREGRYVILKLKHMSSTKKACLGLLLSDYEEYCVDAVVVEAGWPIYEGVWDAVQRLSEGKPQLINEQQKQIIDLQRRVTNLIKITRKVKELYTDQQKQIDELSSTVLVITQLMRNILPISDGGRVLVEAAIFNQIVAALNASPTQSLAEHNARVIETMLASLQDPNYPPMMYDRESMEEYASNIRKQGEK